MSNPKLNGIVQSAPNKSLGFDASTPISSHIAQAFYNQGYRFCIRYIFIGSKYSDLSYEEASGILEGGFALMPAQHVPEPEWLPTADLGKNHGENTAVSTDKVGFPPKVNVWCSLEEISSSAKAPDVIDYCNAWYDAVAAWGYIPGLYVPENSILNGEQLSNDLKFQHFWQSEGNVPNVYRGYQMVRSYVIEPVNGIGIDKLITYIDDEGGQPQWLIKR